MTEFQEPDEYLIVSDVGVQGPGGGTPGPTGPSGADGAVGPAGPAGPAGGVADSILPDELLFNVMDHGAVGNGVANDTAAIQATIDAADAAGGHTVWFPKGTYLTDSLTWRAKVKIQGLGRDISVIKARSNTINVFVHTVTGAYTTGFEMSDLTLDSNGKTGICLIKLDGGSSALRMGNIFLKNLILNGTADKGIWIKFGNGSWINNCTSVSVTQAYTIEESADTNINSCFAVLGSGAGFRIIGIGGATPHDEGLRLNHCITNGQATALQVSNQDWGIATGCSFTTCSVGAVNLDTCTNWSFVNCEFAASASATGLYAGSACDNIVVTGCKFAVNSFGMLVNGNSWAITNNVFWAGANVDIYLGTVTNLTIVGNSCQSTGQPWSILVATSAANCTVANNATIGYVSGFDNTNQVVGNVEPSKTYIPEPAVAISSASSATPTPDVGQSHYELTALAAAAAFAVPTGTPYNGQLLRIRIKDNGTLRALTWNAVYRAVVALPTTTVANKTHYIEFCYNSQESKWDCIRAIVSP